MRVHRMILALLVAASLGTGACAGKRAPILVGNAAVAVADSIGQLNIAGKNLTDAAVMPPAVNLRFQQALLAANDKLKPLPDILRTIDRLQQAGDSSTTQTEQAIAILTVVGQDISVVVAGVPVSEATNQLISLIRSAQQAVQTVLIEVSKIRGRNA